MPYIGKSTTIGVRQRYMYTATASQTTFSGTDTQNLTLTYTDSNFVDVYLNGVLLKTGTDYTATSGTSVVLASGAVADDIVENLGPLGCAVILEAQHGCMKCRGVKKQNSVMITSAMRGVFFDKPEARTEVLQLIRSGNLHG